MCDKVSVAAMSDLYRNSSIVFARKSVVEFNDCLEAKHNAAKTPLVQEAHRIILRECGDRAKKAVSTHIRELETLMAEIDARVAKA